jgi:hypothetical protein
MNERHFISTPIFDISINGELVSSQDNERYLDKCSQEFWPTLDTGCAIEKRQLESYETLTTL